MQDRRVVITGLGVVNAAGTGLPSFWDAVCQGECRLSTITRFDAAGFPVQLAGEVGGWDPGALVPRRFLAKSDRFTHLAFVAAAEALHDSGLDLDSEDRGRVGAWLGNNTGGWDLCERGFVEYYGQGPTMVNPWQATAWFLAAPQGFLTIRNGLQGMSKSFSGDRAAGATAFYYGVRSIQWNRTDVVLSGGCEAPITPLSILCFHANGDISCATDPSQAYRPFDRSADGLVVGEGGAIVVLEEAERAYRRGANIQATVLGGALGTAHDLDPDVYAGVLARALDDAGCEPADIGLVLCEGCGNRDGDRFEAAAIASVFGRDVPVSVPKSIYGHLYGAAFGTDVVCGVMAVREQTAPPTVGFETSDLPSPPAVVRTAHRMTVRRVLIASHSHYGTCVAMVLGAPPANDSNGRQ